MTRPRERPARVLVELAAAAAVAAVVHLALTRARPPTTAPSAPPPPSSPAARDAVPGEGTSGGRVPAAAAAEQDVDTAAAHRGAAAAALLALPYADWDAGADPRQRGVTVYDRARAWPGWNLYTNDVDEAYLIDLEGRRVHRWRAPPGLRQCEHAELLDDGDLLLVCVGQGLVRLDWGSNPVWQTRLDAHHDVAVLADDSLVVPVAGPPQRHRGRQVIFDSLVALSADGVPTGWRWSSHQHLDALRARHPPSPLDTPPAQPDERLRDYYHLNSVEALPPTTLGADDPRFRAGNLLLCLRNANLIVVIDRVTGEPRWHWGPGELDLPHMPTMLPNGHLLVFDNGVERGHSRVVEVDPRRSAIVWQYRGDPPAAFHSRWRGASQRLANGNTLIAESEKGHLFEVTPEGTIVWAFWNPEVQDGKRRRIYRVTRIGVERMRALHRLRARRAR